MTVTIAAILALAAAASPSMAQVSSDLDTVAGQRMSALVTALNTGDTTAIRAFVVEHYEPDANVDREVAYWTAVHREVGPLSFHGTQLEGPEDRRLTVFWHRGTVTRAWIGLELRLEAEVPYRITGRAVLRGVRPRIAPDLPAVPVADLGDSLEAFLTPSAEADYFSGVVVVAHEGRTVFERAYGLANRAAGIPNTLDTRFSLASIAKMFTGVAIAQLAERGLLEFDDPIGKYIPEYPEHIGRQVTIRHLLTHTSGIELDNDPEFNAALLEARSIDDLLQTQLRYIERLNPGNYENFTPLNHFDYTNEGIDLLGVIIERVSGQSWSDFLTSNVFAPVGMTDTGSDLLTPVPSLAKAYTSRGEGGEWLFQRRDASPRPGTAWLIRPAGTGYSTAPDMLRFLEGLRKHTILRAESVELITSPQVEVPVPPGLGVTRFYGYTFDLLDSESGVRAIGHTGGARGMSTVVQFYPNLGYTVIVLSNYDRTAWWVNLRIRGLIGAS